MREKRTLAWGWIIGGCLAVALICVGYPLYVLRPERPQRHTELIAALTLLRYAPWLMAVAAALAVIAAILYWRARASVLRRGMALAGAVVVCAAAAFTRINIFELLFHPMDRPRFESARDTKLDGDEKVLAIRVAQTARAYPIRALAYHHIVNDVVNGVPIAATYWTLCHTGLVWGRKVNGVVLTFHLAGINNLNFVMRDAETGTYWQQVSGRAIAGPLAGSQLERIPSDELSLALWKPEEPRGTILQDARAFVAEYAPRDWDKKPSHFPVPGTAANGPKPRELMLGTVRGDAARAWSYQSVVSAQLVEDRAGSDPVLLVAGPDGASVRGFLRRLPDSKGVADFYRIEPGVMMDSVTGTHWNFQGCGTAGPLQGACLEPIQVTKDYWFDWQNYHPHTTVFGKASR